MNRVVHFEISVDDVKRAVQFYQDVFDWEIKKWGDMEYWLITTGKENTSGIDGAIMKRSFPAGSGTVNTISVEDIQVAIEKITKAGGTTISDIEEIPTIGLFCYCTDTEKNRFGILQPYPCDNSDCL